MKLLVGAVFLLSIGILIGYSYGTYQVKTNQQKQEEYWGKVTNQKNQEIASLSAQLKIDEKSLTIDDILGNKPTPTQPPIYNPESILPSWCKQVINAWMGQGYSRATTNQLMKKDNPECTY